MAQAPERVPVPVLIPTSKFPHLKRIVETLELLCPECSRVKQTPIWFKFKDALEKGWVEPIAGPAIPGRQQVSKDGMIATSFTVFCIDCGAPAGQPSDNGVLDLSVIPADWVQNKGGIGGGTGNPVNYDGDIPVAVMPKGPIVQMDDDAPTRGKMGKGGKKHAKVSDMNPANRNAANKRAEEIKAAKAALARAKKSGMLGNAIKENASNPDYKKFVAAQVAEGAAGKKGTVKNV